MEFTTNNVHDDNNSSSNNNNNNNNNPAKRTKGRRKIEMKKIEKNTDLSISFSKRKSGIYKKGSELATLTGCPIGFLAFSPSGKPITFANPSFDYIVKSYLGEIHNQQPDPLMEVFRHDRIDQSTYRYTDMLNRYENRERQKTNLLAMLDRRSLNKWWNKSIDDVQDHEIEGLANAYLDRWNMVEQSRREKMLGMDGFVQTDSINGVPNLPQPLPDMEGPILLEPVPDFSMVGLPSDGGEDTGSFSAVGPNGGREAEAFGSFSMVGTGRGENEGVGSSSIFTFPHIQ